MMTSQRLVWSDHPLPPGRVLRREIEAREMTITELAELTRRSSGEIDGVINARVAVTDAIASDLERALGIPAYLWIRLEAGYRATLAHNELVAREGPIHTCDLGENCPTQQTYEDEEDEKEESEISAHMLMDEGE